jgi:hypothetical protein
MKSRQIISPVLLIGAFLLLGFFIFFYIYTNGNLSNLGSTDIRSKASEGSEESCANACNKDWHCRIITDTAAKAQCVTNCLNACNSWRLTPRPTRGTSNTPRPTNTNRPTPRPNNGSGKCSLKSGVDNCGSANCAGVEASCNDNSRCCLWTPNVVPTSAYKCQAKATTTCSDKTVCALATSQNQGMCNEYGSNCCEWVSK